MIKFIKKILGIKSPSKNDHIDISYLSKKLLDSQIDRIESVNNYIKVWLKEEKE